MSGKIAALKKEKTRHLKRAVSKKEEKQAQAEKSKKKKFKLKRVHGYISLRFCATLCDRTYLVCFFQVPAMLKEIDIAGNTLISEGRYRTACSFSEGDKMFSINTGRAEENIALLPAVSVTVERSWWNSCGSRCV